MGRNTTNLFMVRLCSLADEITRSRAGNSAEAKFFSTLLSPFIGAFFRAENKAAARQQGYQCRSERRPAWKWYSFADPIWQVKLGSTKIPYFATRNTLLRVFIRLWRLCHELFVFLRASRLLAIFPGNHLEAVIRETGSAEIGRDVNPRQAA